ncbi:MAG: hypothetical protein ACE149_17415 [Armatimonadota bacterium]
MRFWLPVLLSAALLAVGAGSALAVPSLAGPTGLVMLPTAEIAPADLWQVTVGHRSFDVAAMYGGGDSDVSTWAFSLLKGVADDAELWVAFQRVTDGTDSDLWEYGGKYQLSENLFPRMALLGGAKVSVGASLGRWSNAVGMGALSMYEEGEGAFGGDVETLRAYLVASKQLVPEYTGEWVWGTDALGTRIVASAGVMYLRVDAEEAGADSLIRPFLGLQVFGRRNLELCAEYRLKDSDLEDDNVFSVAVRKPFGNATIFEAGLTNGDPIGLGNIDATLYLRLAYSWPTEAYQ